MNAAEISSLKAKITQWALELGFQQVGFASTEIPDAEAHLKNWLEEGFQGEMHYMEKHGSKRTRPAELEPHTKSVISVRMDYWQEKSQALTALENPAQAYIAQYAQGRDYHKLMRKRLANLAKKIEAHVGGEHRAFVDSAPVMERALAEQAGLGWIGKNTMLINSKAGSWFFLGEIYTSLMLYPEHADSHTDSEANRDANSLEDKKIKPNNKQANHKTNIPLTPVAVKSSQLSKNRTHPTQHCGSCTSCLDICPTNAFNQAWQLDARKCISYLTIEFEGSIPLHLRPLIGNRIFGCDDCIIICPWNKFAQQTQERDFETREVLNDAKLLTLFNWSEVEYLKYTEGSALRRLGYQRWLRNLAVGLGNAPKNTEIFNALDAKKPEAETLALEHIEWAQQQHR